jgi:PKD repeat protein
MCPDTLNGALLMYRYTRIIFLSIVIAILVCATGCPPAAAAACDHPVDPILLGACQKDTTASESQVVLRCVDSSTSLVSQPIDKYSWNFGEGSGRWVAFGENKNAMYEYAGGEVLIYHSVETICSRLNKSIIRTTFSCNSPAAGFTVDKDSGVAPLTVRITDTSQHTPTDVTTWQYRKDDVQFSTQKNPALTFSSPGTYTITQHVKKTCSPVSDTASRTIKVKSASGPALIVSMVSLNPSSGTTTTATPASVTITTTATIPPAAPETTASGAGVPGVYSPTGPVAAASGVLSPVTSAAFAPAGSVAGTPATAPAQNTLGTGTLSVVTRPEGAQVYVDDVMRGLSPANIPALPAGQHTLRLEKSGYRNMTVPVSIEAGKTTDYSTGLEAESGGMGIVPIIAAVLVIAAIAGAAVWYLRKNTPATGGQK